MSSPWKTSRSSKMATSKSSRVASSKSSKMASNVAYNSSHILTILHLDLNPLTIRQMYKMHRISARCTRCSSPYPLRYCPQWGNQMLRIFSKSKQCWNLLCGIGLVNMSAGLSVVPTLFTLILFSSLRK